MVVCFAPDCHHTYETDKENCKFFRFPKDEKQKKAWVQLIRRGDCEPTVNSRICSCHFPNGSRNEKPILFHRNHTTLLSSNPLPKRRILKPVNVIHSSPLEPFPKTLQPVSKTAPPLSELPPLSLNPKPIRDEETASESAGYSQRTLKPVNVIPSSPLEPFPKALKSADKPASPLFELPPPSLNPEPILIGEETASRSAGHSQRPSKSSVLSVVGNSSTELDPESSHPITDPPDFRSNAALNRHNKTILIDRTLLKVTPLVQKEDRSTNTDFSFKDNVTEAENYLLRSELEKIKKESEQLRSRCGLHELRLKPKCVPYYTGFANLELLEAFLSIFDDRKINYYLEWNVTSISRHDQIIMTLLKLRLNMGHIDLAFRFNCSTATVTNIVVTWIHVFHEVIFKGLMHRIPSTLKNMACLPSSFSHFPNCRIILDCTEIYIQTPGLLSDQKSTYSNYKHHNTFKGLIGISPNGVATFVSPLYPGSMSDKEIVKDSGVLDQMEPGDLILADKGFLISDIVPPGVSVNIPPFRFTSQFTPGQVERTTNIAKARIHVERAINRAKCYDILECIPVDLFPYATEIWQVCVALTNFRFPLIKEVDPLLVKLNQEV